MNSYRGTLALLMASLGVHAQVLEPGTSIVIPQGATITTNTPLVIKQDADIANSGTIIFDSDLNNNGNKALTGVFIANGQKAQVIDGLDSFAIELLELRGGSDVTLNSTVTISKSLDLEKGILKTTSEHPVLFAPGASVSKESEFAHINGTAVMQDRSIGTGAVDFLGVYINAGTDLGTVNMIRTTGMEAVMPIGDGNSIAAKWEVNTTTDNAAGHDITFNWLSVFDNGIDPRSLSLYGNIYFDTSEFIKLHHDADRLNEHALYVNFAERTRSFARRNIDYVNRTYTLAGRSVRVDAAEKNKIITFPNPATDHINILLDNYEAWAPVATVRITDAYSKVITEQVYPLNGNMIRIDNISSLGNGVYRLFVIRGKLVQVTNFIKQ